jgi:hypothetical protein
MSNQEQERLKRLREQQLSSRDPLAKQRQFQRSSAVKEKRMRKPFSLSKAWKDIPHIIKVPFYGLCLGALLVLFLPSLWPSKYAILVAGGVTVVLIMFGIVVGNALDIRDNLKDNMK